MKDLDDLDGTAEYLGITSKSLYRRRERGEGPPAVKLGRLLRFRKADVDAWLAAHSERQTAS